MSITPFLIAKHLSDLVGRPVNAVRADKLTHAPQVVFACYEAVPTGEPAVIKLDLPLLASLAGVMMGVPSKMVEAQVKAGLLDEQLDDASREIMNIVAAIFQKQRVLFRGLYPTPDVYSADADAVMRTAWVTMLPMTMSVPGYPGGSMTVAANFS